MQATAVTNDREALVTVETLYLKQNHKNQIEDYRLTQQFFPLLLAW